MAITTIVGSVAVFVAAEQASLLFEMAMMDVEGTTSADSLSYANKVARNPLGIFGWNAGDSPGG